MNRDPERLTHLEARLLAMSQAMAPADLLPALSAEASELAIANPYAFALGCRLDCGRPAEVNRTIPYDMKQALGHLDPSRIDRMSLGQLRAVITKLRRKLRFVNDAPKTIPGLARIVVRDHGGDAAGTWKGWNG